MTSLKSVEVKVPATSANLGPGFDAFGLALQIYDTVRFEPNNSGRIVVAVSGQGAGEVPNNEKHLVAQALLRGLQALGVNHNGFVLHCENNIFHGRGLGSSAAATVAGLSLANNAVPPENRLTKSELLQLAVEFEGHPDNAAPAIYGGATISWHLDAGVFESVSLALNANLAASVLVPTSRLETVRARSVLPAQVPHEDAVFNASRAALLTLALTTDLSLLYTATQDLLHQNYRSTVMPDSWTVLNLLREQQLAAAISGAGPTVLVLFDKADQDQTVRKIEQVVQEAKTVSEWKIFTPGIDLLGTIAE